MPVRTFLASIALLLTLPLQAQVGTPPGGYAVVSSKTTLADPEWKAVADALVTRHGGQLVPFEGSVRMARAGLSALMPGHVAFVLRPAEAGRQALLDIHRMTRRLDADPYTDTLWGVVTGYTAEAAGRLVAPEAPLLITRGAAGTGLDLEPFDTGTWYSEGEAGVYWEKRKGTKAVKKKGPQDSTRALVNLFNVFRTQFFMTSGHATERDWQPGFSYRNGQFRCRDGQAVGIDLKRELHPIDSPEPKVWLAAGNCLLGHVNGRDALALALMNTAGVRQLVGYTVVTWYGSGGWGTKDWFLSEPGQRSFAEAWFANNQVLTWRLLTEYPSTLDVEFQNWRSTGRARAQVRRAHGEAASELSLDALRHNTGLLWDRDTVAFYGDPAYAARLRQRKEPWTLRLAREENVYTLTLETHDKATIGGRVFHWLPERIGPAEVLAGAEHGPVITDCFVMLPKVRELEAGQTLRVRFRAAPAPSPAAARPAAPGQAREPEPQPEGERQAATLDEKRILELVPGTLRKTVAHRLPLAGDNRHEILAALARCPDDQRHPLAWLLGRMPEADLAALGADFLLDNVRLACQARNEVPWGAGLPEEIFLAHVLPYASVNERRDRWRADFHERFGGIARSCKSPREALARLNVEAFRTFGVAYHPSKRPKPDQSPLETIEARYASCTGLSIMLIDACRAVGVPARFAGTPRWTKVRGNHSWVEVWDGEWLVIGACEPGEPNKTWFMGRAAEADASRPRNRIYAVEWGLGDTFFPLVWKPGSEEVAACDVTPFYTRRRTVSVSVEAREGLRPLSLALRHGGRLVAHAVLGDRVPTFTLAGLEPYVLEVVYDQEGARRVHRQSIRPGDEPHQSLRAEL